MSRQYRTYNPEQTLLMPPSLKDWLAEDHLAYFISDAVEAMDLSAFEEKYGDEGPGNQAFDPRMMVKVLIYGYATGVFSSRKIASKLTEDVAFRVLGAGNFPAHRTISDFRKMHLQAFRELFVQVVLMAREAGLVKLGTVAIDGTKMRANASKRKAQRNACAKRFGSLSIGPNGLTRKKTSAMERIGAEMNCPTSWPRGRSGWRRSRPR